nr:hypothetical protein CFP56_68440 [Quercus suber]
MKNEPRRRRTKNPGEEERTQANEERRTNEPRRLGFLPTNADSDRRTQQHRPTDGCGYGSRPLGGAIADLLLGLLKSLPSAAPVLEENKGVAFGLIEDAVSDRLTILDLAVLAEDEGEGFDDGVPAEVVDEDLAVGGVCIGELTHDFNQVRVLAHSLLDQSHEMLLRERL